MTSEAIRKLDEAENHMVSTAFERRFSFRAGVTSSSWPAITEPADSVTWSLDSLPDDSDYVELDKLVELINTALLQCTSPEGALLFMDWYHSIYRFKPHLLGPGDAPRWPRSPIPDGDYIINIAEDFSYGTFGHPWEWSLCVMGTPLLDRVADGMDRILPRRLRVGGRPT